MSDKPTSRCLLCGQPSPKSICDTCAQRVQGEQYQRKQKDEKRKP